MSHAAHSFNKISTERALGLCRTDPEDDEILLTDTVQGLCAIGEPGVKAVILEGEVSPIVKEFMDQLDNARLRTLVEQVTSWNPMEQPVVKFGPLIPAAFLQEAAEQLEVFASITGRSPVQCEVFRGVENTFTGEAHVDGGLTVHKGYAEAGIQIFPGKMLKSEFNRLRSGIVRKPPASRILPAGHMIIFKGEDVWEFPHKVSEDRQRGLIHSSPRLYDPQYAARRFALAVF